MILEAGVDSIRAHSRTLTEEVIRRADGLGLELQSPREPDRRAGLVSLRMPGGSVRAQRILHALLGRDVVLDARGDALRISPHFFNDADDIDRCFTELRAVL